MDLEKIAAFIKTKRKEKKLTQGELAEKLNVTEKAISRWETGRGTPDISLLIPLSKVLGVEISDILSGSSKEEAIEKVIEYENNRKQTKNHKPLIISIILYGIFLLLYLLYLKTTYKNTAYEPAYLMHLLLNIFFCVLIILSNWNLYTNYYDRLVDIKKMKKITYGIILLIYIIMILNLTIFIRPMYPLNLKSMLEYKFKYGGLNLIPFKTILDYILHFRNRWPRYILINIIGNLLVFMPVQYLFMKIVEDKKLKFYLIIDFIFILIIETLQLLTGCGVFDIDDILLNLTGMTILYCFVRKYTKSNS